MGLLFTEMGITEKGRLWREDQKPSFRHRDFEILLKFNWRYQDCKANYWGALRVYGPQHIDVREASRLDKSP